MAEDEYQLWRMTDYIERNRNAFIDNDASRKALCQKPFRKAIGEGLRVAFRLE